MVRRAKAIATVDKAQYTSYRRQAATLHVIEPMNHIIEHIIEPVRRDYSQIQTGLIASSHRLS